MAATPPAVACSEKCEKEKADLRTESYVLARTLKLRRTLATTASEQAKAEAAPSPLGIAALGDGAAYIELGISPLIKIPELVTKLEDVRRRAIRSLDARAGGGGEPIADSNPPLLPPSPPPSPNSCTTSPHPRFETRKW